MLRNILILIVFAAISSGSFGQEKKTVQVISRKVEGEIRTLYNDTIFGDITVLGSKPGYITSIEFKEKGKKKVIYSAGDIKRFRQTVPFPDRPEFLVDEVYYESGPAPEDEYKKVFLQVDEWK